MSIRDRGIIKFMPALLPPELRSMLKQIEVEQNYQTKPSLDEQQLEHINQIICESMEHGLEVKVVYFENNRNNLAIGKIHLFKESSRTIRIVNRFSDYFDIPIEEVVDVFLVYEEEV
ncbi:YolD-like family protein [Cytobacillus sp. FJAT-54145]|uniref:YolD-like family protein n=1 Tax=Cytobacillus spartinae TaxID=3299023 RepID=A0ABW6KI81_9BACI